MIGIEKGVKTLVQRSPYLLNGFKEVGIIIFFLWYANHSYMINLTLIKNVGFFFLTQESLVTAQYAQFEIDLFQ